MADKVSYSRKLNFVSNYNDGDTRSLSIPNPITDTEQISTKLGILQERSKNVLVGDKSGGIFTHLSDARVIETTETNLDLE